MNPEPAPPPLRSSRLCGLAFRSKIRDAPDSNHFRSRKNWDEAEIGKVTMCWLFEITIKLVTDDHGPFTAADCSRTNPGAARGQSSFSEALPNRACRLGIGERRTSGPAT